MRPWIARGFLHGFLLPLTVLLTLHGLLFAFYRSPLDFLLRGHWGDGVRWNRDFDAGWVQVVVTLAFALVIAGDATRRWLGTWKHPELPRLDLFWSGLVAGFCLYGMFRQVGTLTQWQFVGSEIPCGIRMLFFGTVSVLAVSRAASTLHPRSPWPGRFRWIGGGLVVLSLAVVVQGKDLVLWQLRRTALTTGDPEDFDRWLRHVVDLSEREAIRRLAWEAIRDRVGIGPKVFFQGDSGEWGAYADSIRAQGRKEISLRSRRRAGDTLSRSPVVDKIWHSWIAQAGDSLRPREVVLDLDWDRSRATVFLDSLARTGGPTIHPDRALPLYGKEFHGVERAVSRILEGLDPELLRVESRAGDPEADIRIALRPYLAPSTGTHRRGVGYSWTVVMGDSLADTLRFASCDTVIGYAPAGRCPPGGDYDQDSLHTLRQGELRWNDLGTTELRLERFLRRAWGVGR